MPAKKKNPRTIGSNKSNSLPPPLPEGEIITDMLKKQWRVGPAIGSGGFGLIYLTSNDVTKKVSNSNSNYVLKIEPKSNGPLYCEINCYMKIARNDLINQWKIEHKINHLGMPIYIASGQHDYSGVHYRFMIMQRFNCDVQKLFEKNGKIFDLKIAFSYANQVLQVLEYIHSFGYVHADIKGSNLLTDIDDNEKIYLVDFGLATRYTQGPNDHHRNYKEDKRKCHDGTIEFTSLDAHRGADPSRRSDIEILGYCLLQWIAGKLPWEDNLIDKKFVMEVKTELMNDPEEYLNNYLSDRVQLFPYINKLYELFSYIKKLEYDEKPNYQYIYNILLTGNLKRSIVSQSTPISKRKKSIKNCDNELINIESKKKIKPVILNDSSENEDIVNKEIGKKFKNKTVKHIKKQSSLLMNNSIYTDDEDVSPPITVSKNTHTKMKNLTNSTPTLICTSLNRRKIVQPCKSVKQCTVSTQTSPGLKGLRNRAHRP